MTRRGENSFGPLAGGLRSGLADTGVRHPTAAAGALGNAYQRKNRGRWETVSATDRRRVLDIQGDDQLAAMVQVTLGVLPAEGAASLLVPPVVGRMNFGTDGASIEMVEFDWLHGSVFSIACSKLEVDGYVETALEGVATCRIGAFVGYGLRGATGSLQRTRLLEDVEPAATEVTQVPQFARNVVPFVTDPTNGFDVSFIDAAGTVLAIERVAALQPPAAYLLPSGTMQVGLTNNGDGAMDSRLVFQLSL